MPLQYEPLCASPDRHGHRNPKCPWNLADNLGDQVAIHIGEAHVAPIESIRELRVIQTEQVQDRGVEIMNRRHLLFGLEAKFITGADDLAALDSRACHPDGHRTWVVVAADASL